MKTVPETINNEINHSANKHQLLRANNYRGIITVDLVKYNPLNICLMGEEGLSPPELLGLMGL